MPACWISTVFPNDSTTYFKYTGGHLVHSTAVRRRRPESDFRLGVAFHNHSIRPARHDLSSASRIGSGWLWRFSCNPIYEEVIQNEL